MVDRRRRSLRRVCPRRRSLTDNAVSERKKGNVTSNIWPIGIVLLLAFGFAAFVKADFALGQAQLSQSPKYKDHQTIHSNIGSIRQMAWSPDGTLLAVMGADDPAGLATVNRIEVFITKTNSKVASVEMDNSKGGGGAIVFSPDGHYLAAGTAIVRVWDTRDWRLVRQINGPYERGFAARGVTALLSNPTHRPCLCLMLAFYGRKRSSPRHVKRLAG